MATREQWLDGARPRTLPAAVAPVLVGTAIAEFEGAFRPLVALLAVESCSLPQAVLHGENEP